MKHPSKHWNASLSFDSDLFQTNRNFFNSCGSSNGSSSNGSLSNGSLSSPEIFELAPGQAECCLSSGCQKGVFQETAMWVRMGCTNPSCTEVKQLHLECFSEWQTRFWNAINNSRSRHFSDFSIPPNITFMKNYDVLLKLCGCRCNAGVLIHEFDQSSPSCNSSNEDFALFTTNRSTPHHLKQSARRTSFSIRDNRSGSFTGSIGRPIGENIFKGAMNGVVNGAVKNHAFGLQNDMNAFKNFNNIVPPSCRYSSPNNNNFNNLQHIISNIVNTTNNNNNFYPPSLLQNLPNNNGNNNNNNVNAVAITQNNNANNNFLANFSSSNNAPTTPTHKKQPRNAYSLKTLDFFPTSEKAASGNIFFHRDTMDSFNQLPPSSRNSYHVRVEDDGPYGNDEIRCFILTTLSCLRKTTLDCVLCKSPLKMFDKYPLVDGTFFLSQENYDKCGVQVTLTKKMQHQQQQQQQHQQQRYLNVVCLACMYSSTAVCKSCGTAWNGSALVVGTMYNFDVFASMPCCSKRFSCVNCEHPVKIFNPAKPPSFFESTRSSVCGKCGRDACHGIKPLPKIFNIADNKKATL